MNHATHHTYLPCPHCGGRADGTLSLLGLAPSLIFLDTDPEGRAVWDYQGETDMDSAWDGETGVVDYRGQPVFECGQCGRYYAIGDSDGGFEHSEPQAREVQVRTYYTVKGGRMGGHFHAIAVALQVLGLEPTDDNIRTVGRPVLDAVLGRPETVESLLRVLPDLVRPHYPTPDYSEEE